MSDFSAASRENLMGVHPTLVQILSEVTQFFDLHIPPGNVRTLADEQKLVEKHLSSTLNSLHIVQKDGYSHAVDPSPTPVNWDNSPSANLTEYEVRCIAMSFYIKGYAQARGIKLRIGADFHGDNRTTIPAFKDLDHIELPIENG
jgi:hypothetical protein